MCSNEMEEQTGVMLRVDGKKAFDQEIYAVGLEEKLGILGVKFYCSREEVCLSN